jgi:hypothetical protein
MAVQGSDSPARHPRGMLVSARREPARRPVIGSGPWENAGGGLRLPMSETHGTPESHTEQDHAPDGHGAATGHEDGAHAHGGHEHAGMALGPVDVRMWLAGILGVAFAIVVTAGFVAATGFAFNA